MTLIATGLMVAESIRAAETLETEGISARVIDMHTVKPLDREAIARAARETGAIVVAEEHLVDGGLGVRVAQVVAETRPVPMEFVGIQNTYAESGTPDELLDVNTGCERARWQRRPAAPYSARPAFRPYPCPTFRKSPRSRSAWREELFEARSKTARCAGQTLHDQVGPLLSAAGIRARAPAVRFPS